MLHFYNHNIGGDTGKAKHNKTTQFRHDEKLASLIEAAATALAVDKSVFLRSVITQEATRILSQQQRHILTPQDAASFAAALARPPAPTERAKQAADLYKSRVKYAD